MTVATIDYLSYEQPCELPQALLARVATRSQNTEDQPFREFQREWVESLPGSTGDASDEESKLAVEASTPTVLSPGELTMERIRHAHGRFVIAITDEQASEIAPFFEGDSV